MCAAPATDDLNTGDIESGGEQRAEVLPPALAHAGAGGGEQNHQAVLEQGGTEHVADCVIDLLGRDASGPSRCIARPAWPGTGQLRTVPGWPPAQLCVPQNRRNYALPVTAYPTSFATDLQAYLDHLAGNDLFAETARSAGVPADHPRQPPAATAARRSPGPVRSGPHLRRPSCRPRRGGCGGGGAEVHLGAQR